MAASSLVSTSAVPTASLAYSATRPRCISTQQLNILSPMAGQRVLPKIQISRAAKKSSRISHCSKTTISCSAAQPETLQIVQSTIAKQLSIDESTVAPQTKFADLGADSLDTVEIMMALEEKFGVSIGEGGAENIATVQDAADLIEKVKAASA